MQIDVTGTDLVKPGHYEGFFLADLDSYNGTDKSGEAFTSLKWTFDMEPSGLERGTELVIFTSDVVSNGSRAGDIITGIQGHPIKKGDRVDTDTLHRVPIRALVGTRKKQDGKETNTISNIERLGDQLSEEPLTSVQDDDEFDDIPF